MTERPKIGTGVLAGTLVAGPVLSTLMGIATINDSHWGATHHLMSALGIGFTIALPFGAVIAVLPVLLGTATMGWIACHNEGARLPAVWAVVGGIAAGIPAWLLAAGATFTAIWAATGAICALAARWQVRWVEVELARRYSDA